MRLVPYAIGCLLFIALPDRVSADYETFKAQAYQAFTLGKYRNALTLYELAYREKPDVRLLYNMGLSHMKIGESTDKHTHWRQASGFFTRFLNLTDGPSYEKLKPARKLAQDYLDKIEQWSAENSSAKQNTSTPPMTSIRGKGPSPHDPQRTLKQRSKLNTSPVTKLHSSSTSTSHGASTWVTWGLWGTGALLGATAIGTGLWAASTNRSGKALFEQGSTAQALDKRSTAKTLAIVTDVLIGAGVASALTGTIYYLLKLNSAPPSAEARVRIQLGAGSVVLSGLF